MRRRDTVVSSLFLLLLITCDQSDTCPGRFLRPPVPYVQRLSGTLEHPRWLLPGHRPRLRENCSVISQFNAIPIGRSVVRRATAVSIRTGIRNIISLADVPWYHIALPHTWMAAGATFAASPELSAAAAAAGRHGRETN